MATFHGTGGDDADDPADDWPEEAKTAHEVQPRGLNADDTPQRPVSLFAGFDAGKLEGLKEGRLAGIYEVIRETRALLVAGKNTPEFIETWTQFVARRCRVKWPPG